MKHFKALKVVPATPEHGKLFLQQEVREADVNEWVMGSGGVKLPVLLSRIWKDRYPASTLPRALVTMDESECLALWGVSIPEYATTAYVWLIASVAAERHPIAIHRFGAQELGLMHIFGGDRLEALVLERNHLHVKWLAMMGFRKEENISLLPHMPPLWGRYARTTNYQEDLTPCA